MAKRICFISNPNDYPIVKEIEIEFEYYSGFSISQKQKSINAMHESIRNIDKNIRILEVSTKSTEPLGVALSAFNLKLFDENARREYPIENIFQSSKMFEYGGPYIDLLNLKPYEAKKDERLNTSGKLICFNYDGTIWDLEPKTMFYDWIYISSLYRHETLSKEILNYDVFTDIEFNQKKSINCQARSVALFVSLSKNGKLENVLFNTEEFRKIYFDNRNADLQTSLFDL